MCHRHCHALGICLELDPFHGYRVALVAAAGLGVMGWESLLGGPVAGLPWASLLDPQVSENMPYDMFATVMGH